MTINPNVPVDNIYNLVAAMVRVAHLEAAGHISHWPPQSAHPPYDVITEDAKAFLADWREHFSQRRPLAPVRK